MLNHMANDNKANLLRRLRIVEGQLRGLQEMIEADKYCIDVITQTSAAKQGLSRIENILLEGHLKNCALKQIKKGQDKLAIAEILKVYELKRR